ncbi:MAG: Gfo/Idh/MocA family oxidoreductase [Firmicutes bacterium]|nr:Gfo/Idh/MocA family oxidoreductase [Bacillota bacterium]
MIRIGIIGSENSHALKFSELANLDRPSSGKRVSGVAVTMLHGDDKEQALSVAKEGKVPHVVDHPTDMLGEIDAVMITARHGDKHASLALPFIEAGIPTFVDKPFAISLDDCQKMIDAAKAKGTLLTSYSTLRYADHVKELQDRLDTMGEIVAGVSTGPCDFSSQYGGPFFYGTHAIETMLAVFGHDVENVTARMVGNNCAATVEYKSGFFVSLNLLHNAAYAFHAVVYGTEGWESVPIDLSSIYANGFRVFIDMIRTGKMPLSYEQLLDPIRILHQVVDATEK